MRQKNVNSMQQLFDEEITLCLHQVWSRMSTNMPIQIQYFDQNRFVSLIQEINKKLPEVEIQNYYKSILQQFNTTVLKSDLIAHLMSQISLNYNYDQSEQIMRTPEEILQLIQQSITSRNQAIEKIFEIFDADNDERLNEKEFKNLVLYYVPTIFPEEYQKFKKCYPSEKVTLQELNTLISEVKINDDIKSKKPNLIEGDFKKIQQNPQSSMHKILQTSTRNTGVSKCIQELQSRTTQYSAIRESNMYEDPRLAGMLSANVAFQTLVKPNFSLIGGKDFQEIYEDITENEYEHVDKEFQASNQSLGSKLQEYKWMRLSSIWPDYQIFVKDSEEQRNGLGKWISPMDIRQGELGDCYFLSTLSSIACRWPDTILELFLTQKKNPYGVLAVKLCIDGIWKAIILDDSIPVKNGNPAFSQSQCEEVWVILLEKAWAKSYGSYSNIISGESREVMRALTGGPTWTLTMKQENFKQQFQDCIQRKCIMTTGTFAVDKNYQAMGLIPEHSYSILKIRNVKLPKKAEITLIKLRNPWGMKEWNGDWSDGHELWTKEIKIQLSIKDKEEGDDENEDGIFYMSYEDFVSYFTTVSVGYFQKNYIYASRQVISNARRSVHFAVDIPEDGEYYFSVIQQSARHFKDKQPDYEYSLIRILFGYKVEEGYEFREGKQDFNQEVYVGGILEKGQYIIEVKVQWKYQEEVIEKSKDIIKQMMIRLARQSQKLAPIKPNFPMIMSCGEKNSIRGIGYDYYKNNSDQILELDCKYLEMKGMKMKKPERGKSYRIVLKPGCEKIVLFSVDLYEFIAKKGTTFSLK